MGCTLCILKKSLRPFEFHVLREGDLLGNATWQRRSADRVISANVLYKGEIAAAIVSAPKRSRTPVLAGGVGRMMLASLPWRQSVGD